MTYPLVPTFLDDLKELCRRIAEGTNEALQGRNNARGTVTLTASSATTTLSDATITETSVVHLMPTTANAQAEGIPYQTGTAAGQVTLNHANNAQADRTYAYVVIR